VAAVARLVTFVELYDVPANPGGMSLSARHEAELADGRRVLLLDDRGWSSGPPQVYGDRPREPAPDIWSVTSRYDIEETARMIVGPDEPLDGDTQADAEAHYWGCLAGILERQGISAEPEDLRRLPHDVVLSERLLARL
jgi:hypothetical protein